MERNMEKKKYPIGAEGYELYEEVGHGVSAAVHRALCVSLNEIVAIKVLDFERDNSDLDNIMREAQTMILIDHPNVLKAHCSFVHKETLWVVMPYMAGGSCLHIMKSSFQDGLEEAVIATILSSVLKALEYLHNHGHIHRDVKAGNILVDSKGGIVLGDFGVSACLFDTGDRMRLRNTFVGTPCWMAPEVLEQKKGYDFRADIWSFGITALELAHGHAPFSKYPPMKVLLMTLQNPPPGLDYARDKHRFSKGFRQMIALCLAKDPAKRPSATKLLKHTFFKQSRSQDYIARKLLDGLPTLGDQYQALKEKEEIMLAQNKMPDNEMEELSQNKYKRGISGWNFDIEDLKAQAQLLPDNEDGVISTKDSESLFEIDKVQEKISENKSEQESNVPFTPNCTHKLTDGEINTHNNNNHNGNTSSITTATTNNNNINNNNNNSSCSNCEEEKVKTTAIQQRGRFKVTSESVDLDKAAPNLSALQKSYSMQVISRLPTFNSTTQAQMPQNIQPSTVYAQLQTILQNNMLQRDYILGLMKQVSIGDLSPASVASSNHSGELISPPSSTSSEKSLLEVAFDREKEYMQEITDLQTRLMRAQDELAKLKEKVSNE